MGIWLYRCREIIAAVIYTGQFAAGTGWLVYIYTVHIPMHLWPSLDLALCNVFSTWAMKAEPETTDLRLIENCGKTVKSRKCQKILSHFRHVNRKYGKIREYNKISSNPPFFVGGGVVLTYNNVSAYNDRQSDVLMVLLTATLGLRVVWQIQA